MEVEVKFGIKSYK